MIVPFQTGDFQVPAVNFSRVYVPRVLPPKNKGFSGRSGARPSDHRPEDAEATLSSGETQIFLSTKMADGMFLCYKNT